MTISQTKLEWPVTMAWTTGAEPVHHLAAGLPGLPPGKAPGHPPQQVRQQRGPGIIGYRGSSDCRVLIVSQTHHDRGSRIYAVIRLTCANTPTVMNYCCRT